jgi:hypothetical protein
MHVYNHIGLDPKLIEKPYLNRISFWIHKVGFELFLIPNTGIQHFIKEIKLNII